MKDLLAKRHLKVSGNHAELVARLVEDDYKKDTKRMKFDNDIPKYLASKREPLSSTVVTIRFNSLSETVNGNTYCVCSDGYLWINDERMLDLTDHLQFKEMKSNY